MVRGEKRREENREERREERRRQRSSSEAHLAHLSHSSPHSPLRICLHHHVSPFQCGVLGEHQVGRHETRQGGGGVVGDGGG